MPRFLILKTMLMFAQKLAWVRVERRREWLGPKHAKMRDKKQNHKWSSSLKIILLIQVAPILWNKQSHKHKLKQSTIK